jgi:hypothetical protein
MSGGATLYTDYERLRGRTMDAIETFPLTFGSKCYNIFQDLDRVLVRKKLIRTVYAPLTQPRDLLHSSGSTETEVARRRTRGRSSLAVVVRLRDGSKMADGGRPSQ